MKGFLQKAAYKIRDFMQGRYGQDELSRFLTVLCFVLLILSLFVRPRWILTLVVWLILIFILFRTFSKNPQARLKERSQYLKLRNGAVRRWNTLKSRWNDRKDYNYYTCPGCRATVRIRKPGKGKTIVITCPKCRAEFRKKT